MSSFELGELGSILTPDSKSASDVVQGKVVSVQTAGIYTITLQGDTSQITGVRSLVPVVANDVIWVLKKGSFLLILNHQDTGWINLTLQNGWVNFGNEWATAQYRKDSGIVYVKGLIKNGTSSSGTILATLPVGFRPLLGYHIAAVSQDNFAFKRFTPNGEISIGGASASASWFDITFSFVAEQ